MGNEGAVIWDELPDDITAEIFSYLPRTKQVEIGPTCKVYFLNIMLVASISEFRNGKLSLIHPKCIGYLQNKCGTMNT
jgi:hypothetical protein